MAGPWGLGHSVIVEQFISKEVKMLDQESVPASGFTTPKAAKSHARMLIRAVFAAVGCAALLAPAGVMGPAVPAASAASYGCSIVIAPTVWVDRPYKSIPAKLGADCAANGMQYAWWGVRHSYYGPSGMFGFDSSRSADTNSFYDWEHYGTYYVEPDWAVDTNSNDLLQNTRSYVVKSGSGVGVSATRVGSYVTVGTWATYYSPSTSGYLMWPKAKVQLQYRTCSRSTCAWTYLRNVSTAANGRAIYRAYAPRTRYYRAVSASNSSIWGRTSGVIIR
jgi:hypothetical protein